MLSGSPGGRGRHAEVRGQRQWLGWRQLARRVGPVAGVPSRSEVAALRLHVARLPGLTSGQFGEAGSRFGPAILVPRLSGRGDVDKEGHQLDEGLLLGAGGELGDHLDDFVHDAAQVILELLSS